MININADDFEKEYISRGAYDAMKEEKDRLASENEKLSKVIKQMPDAIELACAAIALQKANLEVTRYKAMVNVAIEYIRLLKDTIMANPGYGLPFTKLSELENKWLEAINHV